jgi:hypothetical protein
MLTKFSIITSDILNHKFVAITCEVKNGYSMQWNSFGIAESPDGVWGRNML